MSEGNVKETDLELVDVRTLGTLHLVIGSFRIRGIFCLPQIFTVFVTLVFQ